MGSGGQWHGKGPKSTPALANGRLFTMSITGLLSAWDAQSGQLLWRSDYGSRFKKSHPYWGASTSPLIDGDRDGRCYLVIEEAPKRRYKSFEAEIAALVFSFALKPTAEPLG